MRWKEDMSWEEEKKGGEKGREEKVFENEGRNYVSYKSRR
jgi:hypothetical protein